MAKEVDIVQFIKELPVIQRGRACVILTREYVRQKSWTEQLADIAEIEHINLLDELGSDHTSKMASFSVDGLFNFLQEKSTTPVLAVSGIEFIKATWAFNLQRSMDQFGTQIELWSKEPALLFVMQYDPMLANMKFNRFPNLQFVIDQQHTLKL